MLKRDIAMTDEDQQPLHPGCIRIIVQLGEMEGGGDFLAADLPEWLQSIDATTRNPMAQATEAGATLAREMVIEAVKQGEWDIACISALWIALYAPDVAVISLERLSTLGDVGVVRITASQDGCTWSCRVTEYGMPTMVLH
jgi:hypothetical protein